MPKGVKNGPQHLRLISRNEAAAILGCSTQTISNWVERGIIKGHKVDNLLLVDKESIEKLFDTASDVAEMEKKLEELRKIINNEIQQEEQKVKRLYEDGQRTIQDKFFKELSDSILDSVKDQLSEREFFIVSGVLMGKPTFEIAKEAGCIVETVRHNWHRIAPKLFEILEYPTVRREKEDLAEENQALKDEIRRLKTDHRERDLLATPFARELLEFGFSPPICRRLMSSGVKTLADLLQYDVTRLLNLPNMGSTSVRKIKERLDMMGLSFGMDLQNMSDQKYEALVEKISGFLPSDIDDRLSLRFRGNESDDIKAMQLKNITIADLRKKLLYQTKSSENWRTKYRQLLDNHNKLRAQIRQINSASRKKKAEDLKEQQLKGISRQLKVKSLQLTDKNQLLKEKNQQLKEADRLQAKMNGQLDKATAQLSKASEREEILLQKISSLESLVEHYKEEKNSANNVHIEKVQQLKEEIQQQKDKNRQLKEEDIQQLKEKVRELNITNAQLRHELSELNKDAISKESLLDRISSLESLVRYYIKERRILFKKN